MFTCTYVKSNCVNHVIGILDSGVTPPTGVIAVLCDWLHLYSGWSTQTTSCFSYVKWLSVSALEGSSSVPDNIRLNVLNSFHHILKIVDLPHENLVAQSTLAVEVKSSAPSSCNADCLHSTLNIDMHHIYTTPFFCFHNHEYHQQSVYYDQCILRHSLTQYSSGMLM